jgi:class 3 adenylate cyclase
MSKKPLRLDKDELKWEPMDPKEISEARQRIYQRDKERKRRKYEEHQKKVEDLERRAAAILQIDIEQVRELKKYFKSK